jgi:hypothetical protein
VSSYRGSSIFVYLGIRDSCVVGESPRTVRDDGEEERSGRRGDLTAEPTETFAFYSVSLMVGIGLGREVGVLVYGVSRLVGGGGMVQVGSGGA